MVERNSGLAAREAALRAMVRFEVDDAYLKHALLSNSSRLSKVDRAFALELSAGSIRYLKTLDWIIEQFSNRPVTSYTPWIRNILRLGAYQLSYLDRIPGYAVVNTSVKLANRFGHRGVSGLVNAILRNMIRKKNKINRPCGELEPVKYLSLRYSYPPWMIERVLKRYNYDQAECWCMENNKTLPVSLRPNLLRSNPEELTIDLRKEGVQVKESSNIPGLLLLVSTEVFLTETEAYKNGLFTIQGESSALAAYLLDVKPGDKVVDLCSAPGGKATHLAEMMKGEGLLYAVEIHERRLKLVEQAANRLGLKNIRTVMADSRCLERDYLSKVDSVLVDAPCSGLGVLRRLPELKWRRREEDFERFNQLQTELLMSAFNLLREGGKMLYAVCSNEPEETDLVIKNFIGNHTSLRLRSKLSALPENIKSAVSNQGTINLLPHKSGMDGFYYALMEKIL